MPNCLAIASAGAGKTEEVIARAFAAHEARALIVTYTKGNAQQIAERIVQKYGLVPQHITITTWFTFLLREAIKPYQSAVVAPFRVRSINFVSEKPKYAKKTNVSHYFLDAGSNFYRDVVSDLACVIDRGAKGRVLTRLEALFDIILVDEVQDLVGYDLEFLDLLFKSRMQVTAVGDPRQHTYSTNRSTKNAKYRGFGLYEWARIREKAGILNLSHMNWSYRCTQPICDFADGLFPDQPPTESRNTNVTGHEGVFLVARRDLEAYIRRFNPVILRWSRRRALPLEAPCTLFNIGAVKGCTFDRVLLLSTKPMIRYLQSAVIDAAGSREHFYVGLTRARQSAALLVDSREVTSSLAATWRPD